MDYYNLAADEWLDQVPIPTPVVPFLGNGWVDAHMLHDWERMQALADSL